MKTDETWIPTERDLGWIEEAAGPVHPVLAAIEAAAQPDDIPILDRASGRLLGVLASGRRRIVEVGTAIGYSTLCMALAMADDGTIVTIDPDEGRTTIARGFWRQAGIADERISVLNKPGLEALGAGDSGASGTGPARSPSAGTAGSPSAGSSSSPSTGSAGPKGADPRLDGPFDLVFIDAIKQEYLAYVEALVPRLLPGALVVADNVLRSGQVSGARDERPGWRGGNEAIRAFDRAMLADPRFRATVLPIGDGLLVAAFVGDVAS